MFRSWLMICGGWLLVPAVVSAQGVGQQRTTDDARPIDEIVVRERADTSSPTARSATEAREADDPTSGGSDGPPRNHRDSSSM